MMPLTTALKLLRNPSLTIRVISWGVLIIALGVGLVLFVAVVLYGIINKLMQ